MKKLQAKHLDELSILSVLERNHPNWTLLYENCEWSIYDAFVDKSIPSKVILAKMRSLIKKGLVSGCDCGCRGDFEITEKGREYLNNAF